MKMSSKFQLKLFSLTCSALSGSGQLSSCWAYCEGEAGHAPGNEGEPGQQHHQDGLCQGGGHRGYRGHGRQGGLLQVLIFIVFSWCFMSIYKGAGNLRSFHTVTAVMLR